LRCVGLGSAARDRCCGTQLSHEAEQAAFYRERAEELLKRAEKISDPERRQRALDMASAHLRLAEQFIEIDRIKKDAGLE